MDENSLQQLGVFLESRILYANQIHEGLAGYTHEELLVFASAEGMNQCSNIIDDSG
ncbi:MAG: hypothetical protein ACXACI_13000 [Candidatus Hodarchaeales archaeon]